MFLKGLVSDDELEYQHPTFDTSHQSKNQSFYALQLQNCLEDMPDIPAAMVDYNFQRK